MPDVGAVSVAMEVSLYNLEAGLRRAENMVAQSAAKQAKLSTVTLGGGSGGGNMFTTAFDTRQAEMKSAAKQAADVRSAERSAIIANAQTEMERHYAVRRARLQTIQEIAGQERTLIQSSSRTGGGAGGDTMGLSGAAGSAIKLGIAVKGVEGGLRLATAAAAAMSGDIDAGVEAMKRFPVAGQVFGAYLDFLDAAVGKSKAIAEAADKAKKSREEEAKRGKELSDALHRQWEIESQMAERRKERILLQAEEGKDREIQAVKLDEQSQLDNTVYGSANYYDIKDTAAAKIADIEKRYEKERQDRIRESSQKAQVLALEMEGNAAAAELKQLEFSYDEKLRVIKDGEERATMIRERENAIMATVIKQGNEKREKAQKEADEKEKDLNKRKEDATKAFADRARNRLKAADTNMGMEEGTRTYANTAYAQQYANWSNQQDAYQSASEFARTVKLDQKDIEALAQAMMAAVSKTNARAA